MNRFRDIAAERDEKLAAIQAKEQEELAAAESETVVEEAAPGGAE